MSKPKHVPLHLHFVYALLLWCLCTVARQVFCIIELSSYLVNFLHGVSYVFIAKRKSWVTDGGERHWCVGQPDGSKHLVCEHERVWRSTQHGACFNKSLPWPWWRQSGNLNHTTRIVTWALRFQCQYSFKDYLTCCDHNLAKPPMSLASRQPYCSMILLIKRSLRIQIFLHVMLLSECYLSFERYVCQKALTHRLRITSQKTGIISYTTMRMSSLTKKKKFAFYHLLTNSKGCSSHKFCFLWTPNTPCRNHKSLPQDPVLSRVNPVHTLKACFQYRSWRLSLTSGWSH